MTALRDRGTLQGVELLILVATGCEGGSQPTCTINVLAASKTWLDLHDAHTLALDRDIPGFKSEWSVTLPVSRELVVVDFDSERTRTSSIVK